MNMSDKLPSYEECIKEYPSTNMPGPTPGEGPQPQGAQGYGSQLPNVSPNSGISVSTVGGNITAYPYNYPVSLTEKSGPNPEVTKTIPDDPGSSYPAPTSAYPVQVPGYPGATAMNYGMTPEYAPQSSTMNYGMTPEYAPQPSAVNYGTTPEYAPQPSAMNYGMTPGYDPGSTALNYGLTPGYAPGPSPDGNNIMQGESTTVIVTSQPQTMAETFQEFPVRMQCPHCHKEIQTQTDYVSGSTSWLWCIILAMFGCLLGCCLIPFFHPSCMDVEHTCPECGESVGTFSRQTPVSSGTRSSLGRRMSLDRRRRRRMRHHNLHHNVHHNIHHNLHHNVHHNRHRHRQHRRRRR